MLGFRVLGLRSGLWGFRISGLVAAPLGGFTSSLAAKKATARTRGGRESMPKARARRQALGCARGVGKISDIVP